MDKLRHIMEASNSLINFGNILFCATSNLKQLSAECVKFIKETPKEKLKAQFNIYLSLMDENVCSIWLSIVCGNKINTTVIITLSFLIFLLKK